MAAEQKFETYNYPECIIFISPKRASLLIDGNVMTKTSAKRREGWLGNAENRATQQNPLQPWESGPISRLTGGFLRQMMHFPTPHINIDPVLGYVYKLSWS